MRQASSNTYRRWQVPWCYPGHSEANKAAYLVPWIMTWYRDARSKERPVWPSSGNLAGVSWYFFTMVVTWTQPCWAQQWHHTNRNSVDREYAHEPDEFKSSVINLVAKPLALPEEIASPPAFWVKSQSITHSYLWAIIWQAELENNRTVPSLAVKEKSVTPSLVWSFLRWR